MSNDTPDDENPEEIEIEQPEETLQQEMVQEAVSQANQFHAMMDKAKGWAREKATAIQVEAALEDDPETADELAQVADLIESVVARIEQGDNNRARQP